MVNLSASKLLKSNTYILQKAKKVLINTYSFVKLFLCKKIICHIHDKSDMSTQAPYIVTGDNTYKPI